MRQLLAQGLLTVDNEGYGTLALTEGSRAVLKGEHQLMLRRESEKKGRASKTGSGRAKAAAVDLPPELQPLFEARAWRGEVAKSHGVPATSSSTTPRCARSRWLNPRRWTRSATSAASARASSKPTARKSCNGGPPHRLRPSASGAQAPRACRAASAAHRFRAPGQGDGGGSSGTGGRSLPNTERYARMLNTSTTGIPITAPAITSRIEPSAPAPSHSVMSSRIR